MLEFEFEFGWDRGMSFGDCKGVIWEDSEGNKKLKLLELVGVVKKLSESLLGEWGKELNMNFVLALLYLFSTTSFNEGNVVAEKEFLVKPAEEEEPEEEEEDLEDCNEEEELELPELTLRLLVLAVECKYWPKRFDELEFGVLDNEWMAEELVELTLEPWR